MLSLISGRGFTKFRRALCARYLTRNPPAKILGTPLDYVNVVYGGTLYNVLGNDGGPIGAPVIIGSAAGGTVLLILVLFILVVVMVVPVASCRRTRSRHNTNYQVISAGH